MPKKFLPSKFNKRVSFGSVKSVPNDMTGDYDTKFVKDFCLWCMPQKRTLNQQYQLLHTELEDSIVLVVRHNSKINKKQKVKYDGQEYSILDVSSDEGFNYMAYDYVTVKLVTKGGG